MQLIGNMKEHLQQIIEKINNCEKFGLIRPADGEYRILENHTFTAQKVMIGQIIQMEY